MRFRVLLLCSGVLALTAELGSCRNVLGVESDRELRQCGDVPTGSQGCRECLEQTCCAELGACAADGPCSTRWACRASCAADDAACRTSCEQAAPFGEVEAKLRACQAGRCPDKCGASCGSPVPVGSQCDPCASACCAEAHACDASLECGLVEVCQRACSESDVGCREACRNKHPEGADLGAARDACVRRACDVSGEWSCVGSVGWAAPTTGPLLVALVVHDIVSGAALPQISLDVCDASDPACNPPKYGSYVTDGAGKALVSLKTGGAAYPGFIAASGSGWFPTLYFFSPPLAANWSIGLEMSSTASITGLAASAGIALDSGRGHVLVDTSDCKGAVAEGVVVALDTADADTALVVVDQDGAYARVEKPTATHGRAVFLNVPAGAARVTTSLARTCEPLGQIPIWVRSGALTGLRTPPTPL